MPERFRFELWHIDLAIPVLLCFYAFNQKNAVFFLKTSKKTIFATLS